MSADAAGVAIVGCGGIARQHIEAIQSLETIRITAAVDIDLERAQGVAAKAGGSAYTSLDDALANEEVEAVHICLPHHLHYEATIKALGAGRHVLVEKPMALSLSHCRDMVSAADKAGVVLMVGQVLRFRSHYRKAKELIGEGAIGRPQHILRRRLMHSLSHPSIPWSSDPAKAGGWLLYGYGAHEVDMGVWLADDRPTHVTATGSRINPHWQDIDEVSALVGFEHGGTLNVIMGLNWHESAWDQAIVGSAGYLAVSEKGLWVNGESIPTLASPLGGFRDEVAEFAAAMKENREPEASGRSVLATMAVLEAVKESIAAGGARIEPAPF